MFCPICKSEYRLGFTRCSDCDVDLVETLDARNAAPANKERELDGVVIWSGADPQAFSAVRDALDWARIFHFAQTRESGVFPNLRGQLYSILVHQDDYRAAEAVLQTVPVLADTADREDEQDSEELAEDSSELQEADSDAPVPDDIPQEDFREAEATAEVWSGDDARTGEAIHMSLRENGIGCIVEQANGKRRVRVTAQSEARAKEIIREVIEATPPE